jgi:hypothetical protein
VDRKGAAMEFRVADTIEVSSNQVGQPPRRGTVREVISTDPAEIRVEWDDGHESNFFPAGGMVNVVSRSEG